jgi:hypothetical protein
MPYEDGAACGTCRASWRGESDEEKGKEDEEEEEDDVKLSAPPSLEPWDSHDSVLPTGRALARSAAGVFREDGGSSEPSSPRVCMWKWEEG